jgi:hypothetical protein
VGTGVQFAGEVGVTPFSAHPGRLWGPLSRLSSGYQCFITGGESNRGVRMTTHLHLVATSRKHGAISPRPHLHGFVPNESPGEFYFRVDMVSLNSDESLKAVSVWMRCAGSQCSCVLLTLCLLIGC